MTTTIPRTARESGCTTADPASTTPGLDSIIRRDPDIVDRMFDYLLSTMPDLRERAAELAKAEHQLRSEFRASRGLHVRAPARDDERDEMRRQVLEFPPTTSAREVARRVGVSRSTVCRYRHDAGVSHPAP